MRILMLALLLVSCAAAAEPLAQITGNDVRITLYSEPCALPSVANLPRRAEWTGRGQTFAGCWSLNVFLIVVMMFDDKTVVSIPARHFVRVKAV